MNTAPIASKAIPPTSTTAAMFQVVPPRVNESETSSGPNLLPWSSVTVNWATIV
jgi:hypothetical protein